jgi:SAM-dependent methyltransferase
MRAEHVRAPAADVALRANLSIYEHFDERTYVSGSPHLVHASIGRIYRSLIEDSLDHIGRDHSSISVLDLGVGNGLASVPWFRHNIRLTAVDSSKAMLREFTERAAVFGANARTIRADVLDYLTSTAQQFDVVTHVSMLHHVPDYLELLQESAQHVRPGGCLITFQDPLRYDRMPRSHHVFDRASYFAWRMGQGNYMRGLKTRWRRLRGIYDPNEAEDFDEYHVVRDGVDSDAIMGRLEGLFEEVKVVPYWSTYAAPLQWAGERLGFTSTFGILASGRRG